MSDYIKTDWVDHIPDIFSGEIIQQGTPITAKRLNKIEQGIYDAHSEVTNLEKKIGSGTLGIHVSATEPEEWEEGEWWYQTLAVLDDNATIYEELKTVSFNPNKAYHIIVDGVTKTITNIDDGSLIIKEI